MQINPIIPTYIDWNNNYSREMELRDYSHNMPPAKSVICFPKPHIQEIKVRAFYEDAITKEFKDLDPYAFAAIVCYIEQFLNEKECTNLYDNVQFDPDLINKEQTTFWGKATPLSTILEKYDNKMAVTCLLRNGANPSQVLDDGRTPLSIAKEMGHEKSVKIMNTSLKKYERFYEKGENEKDLFFSSTIKKSDASEISEDDLSVGRNSNQTDPL